MKTAVITLLIICVAAISTVAWRQHRFLSALSQSLASLEGQNKALQENLREVNRKLTAVEEKHSSASSPKENAAKRATSTSVGAVEQSPAALTALLDNPSVQQGLAASLRGTLDQRYARMFRDLHLTPDELNRLKDLMTEKLLCVLDAVNLARAQDPTLKPTSTEIAAIVTKLQTETDQTIHAMLGDQNFHTFQDYSKSIDSYRLLDQFEQRLNATDAPLQPAQEEWLLTTLKESLSNDNRKTDALANLMRDIGSSNPMMAAAAQQTISDALIASAQSILTPTQITVIKQMQKEQETQQKLIRTMTGRPAPAPKQSDLPPSASDLSPHP